MENREIDKQISLSPKYFMHPTELYRAENTGEHYAEWLYKKWDYSIKLALKLRMQIIPLQHLSKRPMFKWTGTWLSYESAMYFGLRGNNLAVVCNKWFLLDLDRPDISAYQAILRELKAEKPTGEHLLTCNSARGFHFWLSWKPKTLQQICEKYKLDVPRHSVMYALIPYSITCAFNGCGDNRDVEKHKHKYIIRRWLDIDL